VRVSTARVAHRYLSARSFEVNIGDPIRYGKYLNKPGVIVGFKENEKGDVIILVDPVPKGRKQTKELKLFRVRYDQAKAEAVADKTASSPIVMKYDESAGWSQVQEPSSERLARRYLLGESTQQRAHRFVDEWRNFQMFAEDNKDPEIGYKGRANIPLAMRYAFVGMVAAGREWSRYVVDNLAFPRGKAKKVEMAVREFARVREPKNLAKWYAANKARMELLVSAKDWPLRSEAHDDVERVFRYGPFTVHNTIHLDDKGLARAKGIIDKALKASSKTGLPGFSAMATGNLYLVGQIGRRGWAAWFMPGKKGYYLRPTMRGVSEDASARHLLHEMGHMYWEKRLSRETKKKWSGYHTTLQYGVDVKMPEPGDTLPLKVNRKEVRIDRRESGLFVLHDAQTDEEVGRVPADKLYKWMLEATRAGRYPSVYAAKGGFEEHFCEALSFRAMKGLSTENEQSFREILLGEGRVQEDRAIAARVAAKYKKKKEVPKADGSGKTTVYEYSDGQVQHRNREKAKRVEKLRSNLDKLQGKVTKDLKSKDDATRLTALAVGLLNDTYERVGNPESAKEGHFGVTGWLTKHVTLGKGKATFKYVGKSGVDQKKTTTDANLIRVLREAVKGKGKDDPVFELGDAKVDSSTVNEYLKPLDITAKDIRGLHANREMKERLKAVRSKGGKLPKDKKEREDKLKAEFKDALEGAAGAVGHESSTLKSQYLVPGLEDDYLKDGVINEKHDKKGRVIDRSHPETMAWVKGFFSRHSSLKPYQGASVTHVDTDAGPEASWNGGVWLYPKFWKLRPQGRDFVFAHELGHGVLEKWGYPALLAKAAELGVDPWDTPNLPFAVHNFDEAFADSFASYHTDGDVKRRYPAWAQIVEECGVRRMAHRKQAIIHIDNATDGEGEYRGLHGLISSLTLYERAIVQDMLIHEVPLVNTGGEHQLRGHFVRPDAVMELVGAGYLEDLGDTVTLSPMFIVKRRLYTGWGRTAAIPNGTVVQWGKINGEHHEGVVTETDSNVLYVETPDGKSHPIEDGEDFVEILSYPEDTWDHVDVTDSGFNEMVREVYAKMATKTDAEREDEEAERLVRQSPKLKPPRKDRRRERMEDGDPDTDEDDKDTSMNRKDIGASRRVTTRFLLDERLRLFLAGDSRSIEERAQSQGKAEYDAYLEKHPDTETDLRYFIDRVRERLEKREKNREEDKSKAPDPGTEVEDAPDPGTEVEDAPDPGTEVEDAPDPGTGVEDAPDPGTKVEDAPDPGTEVEDAPDPGTKVKDAPDPGDDDEDLAEVETRIREEQVEKMVGESAKAMKSILKDQAGFDKDFQEELRDRVKDLSRADREALSKGYTEAIEELKSDPPEGADALKMAREALGADLDDLSPEETGQAMARAIYAERVVFNPLLAGGRAVTKDTNPATEGEKEEEETARRELAEEAYQHYGSMTEKERKDAADVLGTAITGLDSESPRARELQAIYNGVCLAALAKGVDPPNPTATELTPPKGERFGKLFGALKATGNEKALLGVVGDFTAPDSRDAIHTALSTMTNAELGDFVGRDSPVIGVVNTLEGELGQRLAPAEREKLRQMVVDAVVDSISLMDPLVGDYADANGEELTPERMRELYEDAEKEDKQVRAKAKQLEGFLEDDPELSGEGAVSALDLLMKELRALRITNLTEYLRKRFKREPSSSLAEARARAVQNEGSVDVLSQRILPARAAATLPSYDFQSWPDLSQ
jgi:hypothetical protein